MHRRYRQKELLLNLIRDRATPQNKILDALAFLLENKLLERDREITAVVRALGKRSLWQAALTSVSAFEEWGKVPADSACIGALIRALG
eukprot:2419862-Amphidinium_carterae.1